MRAPNIRRRFHGCLVIAGIALLVAAGPGHAQQEPVAPDLDLQRLENGGAWDLSNFNPGRYVSVDTVAAPLDSVWRALPKAYQELGIKEVHEAPASWMVGNTGFNVRHQLGNRRVSRYLNCGYGQTGPMADDAIVHVRLLTQLVAAGSDRTIVRSALDATATPTSVSGGPTRCQTTGQLETAIADALVRASVGGTP